MYPFKYKITIYDSKGKLLNTYAHDDKETCLFFYQKLIKEEHAKKWIIEVAEILEHTKGSEV